MTYAGVVRACSGGRSGPRRSRSASGPVAAAAGRRPAGGVQHQRRLGVGQHQRRPGRPAAPGRPAGRRPGLEHGQDRHDQSAERGSARATTRSGPTPSRDQVVRQPVRPARSARRSSAPRRRQTSAVASGVRAACSANSSRPRCAPGPSQRGVVPLDQHPAPLVGATSSGRSRIGRSGSPAIAVQQQPQPAGEPLPRSPASNSRGS